MQVPPTPVDEPHRLEALQSLHLLDSKPQAQFDSLVRVAQRLFDIEICLISLVDAKRQWFLACVGLDAKETGRDISFCGHAIIREEVFVVRDALQDARFHDNPLVVGPPFIRFYAGVPLRIPLGYNLGTLCIISPKPRPDFGSVDEAILRDLGNLAISAIAARALHEDNDKIRELHDQHLTLGDVSTAPMALVSSDGKVTACNPAFNGYCGIDVAEGRSIETLLTLPESWRSEVSKVKELRTSSRIAATSPVVLYESQNGYMVAG
jgi:hypothetical protein